MKTHVYENKKILFILSFLLFIIEFLTLLYMAKQKSFRYQKYSGVVTNNNELILLVTKKEKKLLSQNSYAYVNDIKRNYEIIEDKGFIMKKNNIKYDEIIIDMKKLNQKVNDTVIFSIKREKDSWMRLLNIMEEDD